MEYLTIECTPPTPVRIEVPDSCPMCNKKIFPKLLYKHFISNSEIIAVFLCQGCQRSFMVKYERCNGFYNNHGYPTKIVLTVPILFVGSKFSNELKNLSPAFVEIFYQAECAEYHKLDKICGMGYRRAIEFLTKDYFIQIENKDETIVKNQFLGKFFNPKSEVHFDDDLRPLLWASVDIANNHSHYDQDDNATIEQLKYFIKAFVAKIELKIATDKAATYIEQVKRQQK